MPSRKHLLSSIPTTIRYFMQSNYWLRLNFLLAPLTYPQIATTIIRLPPQQYLFGRLSMHDLLFLLRKKKNQIRTTKESIGRMKCENDLGSGQKQVEMKKSFLSFFVSFLLVFGVCIVIIKSAQVIWRLFRNKIHFR